MSRRSVKGGLKLTLVFCWLAVGCVVFTSACEPTMHPLTPIGEGDQRISQERAAKLILNYPSVKYVKDNTVYFINGTGLPFDDGQTKKFDGLLQHPDIEDQFAQNYPAFAPIVGPPPNYDPGRFRNDEFLKKLYGRNKSAVEKNLVEVDWIPAGNGRKLRFNKNENAARQLQKVAYELDKLSAKNKKYIINIDSTFEYRPIQGTNRLSPHSYGIAIDLETKYTRYWLWDKKYHYVNEIPMEIVEIFERHGFIWGGRWYHYDTMHFEYRPEMFERVL